MDSGERGQSLFAPRGAAAFLGLALVVGILVGLGAALLIFAISWVGDFFTEVGDAANLGRWLPLVALPTGVFVAWLIAEHWAPEVRGDGVPEATAGLAIRSGYLPTRAAPLKIAATAATLGAGGSAGREGPIVQIGSAIGSSLARHTGLGEDQVRSLVAAGAGAAIGASFNAPIAGMLFAMEVILGHFAIRHLNAVVVASVAAAVTSRSIVGEERLLRAFPFRIVDSRELALYAALGVLAVVAAWLFLRILDKAETLGEALPRWGRPLLIAVAVAGIGVWEPRILGTGQNEVAELLRISTVVEDGWWVLAGLAGLKILATSGTIGSGSSGGAFMPSLFIGATLGAGFALLVEPVWGWSVLQPGAFAIVGMAATFAAVARAPLTAIIIVFEITGDYGLVLPLMLAASLATFLADRIHPESVYTMPLVRRGIRLVRHSEVDLLDTVKVGDVIVERSETVTPKMSTAEVRGRLDRLRSHGLPVVADGRLVGIVTITDVLRVGGASDQTTASEAMTPRPVTVTRSTPVSVALERMAALGVGRLPVVEEDDPEVLCGLFKREDAVRAYHYALSTSTHDELSRQRLRTRVHPGADFFEFTIPPGSVADGRLVREVAWPAGLTVVSIRRGRAVLVPEGNTELCGGDVLTAFGRPAARERLRERFVAGAEPTTA